MFKITLITGILVLTGILDAAVYAQETDPVLTSSAKYSMPESALNAEIGGTVVMGISVDATGKPARAVLISGPMWPCGADPAKALEELSATLTETMMSLRFTPGTTDGKPDEKAIALTLQLKNPKLALVPGPVDPATGKPRPTRISGGVLNGKATELPKPAYPAEARTNRDSGAVSIEVLIDEDGKIFHESVNDMPLGRNVNEYLRLIDAYTHVQTKGEVCPANWEEGKDAMSADRNSTAAYLASL